MEQERESEEKIEKSEEFCTANMLEDCDEKKVNIVGSLIFSKTNFLCDIEEREVKYAWLGDCILITNPETANTDLVDKKVEVVGVIKASTGELCGVDQAEQCAGKYYPTMIQIEEIKVKVP